MQKVYTRYVLKRPFAIIKNSFLLTSLVGAFEGESDGEDVGDPVLGLNVGSDVTGDSDGDGVGDNVGDDDVMISSLLFSKAASPIVTVDDAMMRAVA